MDSSLTFILKLQDQLSGGMRSAAASSDAATSRISGGIRGVMALAGPLIGAFAGFSFLKDSVSEANNQAQALAQLDASLLSTKNAVGLSRDALISQAEALQKTTLYGDDATEGMQSLLLTFTNIKGKIFTDAVPAIQDLATKMGTDLPSAAVQVGKALNDPIKGITALSRVGVSFTDSQKATIEQMVKTNNTAGAQALILAELNKEFGGSAEAAARAGAGPFKQLQMRLGDVQEELGGMILKLGTALMPLFNRVVDTVGYVVQSLRGLYHWFREHQVIAGILTTVVGGIVIGMTAYNAILMISSAYTAVATAVTSAWATVQLGLNAAMMANPLAWVIGLIIALIAIIGLVVYAVDGWGKQWDQVVKFMGYTFASFKDFFVLTWLNVQNVFMTGLDTIEKGWYKLKSLWDEDGAAAGLAKINDEQNKRAAEIAAQRGKLVGDLQGASKSLTWELSMNGKGLSTIGGDLKKKLGLGGAAGVSALSAGAGGGLGAGGGAGAAGAKALAAASKGKADGVNAGGQRSVVININKMIEKIEQNITGGAKEVASDIGSAVREEMVRVMYSLNGVATN